MNLKPNNSHYSVVPNLCLDAGFLLLLRNINKRYRFVRSFRPVKWGWVSQERRDTPYPNTANLKNYILPCSGSVTKRKYITSFLMYVIVFCLPLANPLKSLRWTVMSQAVLSFRLRGSFGETTLQSGVFRTHLCVTFFKERLWHPISLTLALWCWSHHVLNVESQLCFLPRLGKQILKLAKDVLRKTES